MTRYQPSKDSVNSEALRSQMRSDSEARNGLKGEELRAWRSLRMKEIDEEMRELKERGYF